VNKIFLAYPFRPDNVPVMQKIDRLVRSHGLVLATAEVVGGEDLTPAIKGQIAKSDAVVAFLAKVGEVAGTGEGITTDWVKSELGYARDRNQRAIAMIEKGVKYDGLDAAGRERISFLRNDPQEAFVRLSETIALWKQEVGRFLEIRLVPKEAEDATETMKCKCRIISGGKAGEWTEVKPRDKPGGVFIELAGVKPDEEIQVQLLEGEQAKWRSKESPQWLHVELRKVP
jgi:hypothetical protein